MPEPKFDGLRDYAESAARQPGFSTIQQRAARVRRRRGVARSAAVATVVLGMTGVGYVAAGSGSSSVISAPSGASPSVSASRDSGELRLADATAAGNNEIYALSSCPTCTPRLDVSLDGGKTWQPRTAPPAPEGNTERFPAVTGYSPGMLVWIDGSANGRSAWTTVDGGKNWRRSTTTQQKLAALPANSRPVDCGVADSPAPCRIYSVDPSGVFAPLANLPTGIEFDATWLSRVNAPSGPAIWVPGVDQVSRKPAVAYSFDSGRHWAKHVFTGAIAAPRGEGPATYAPTISTAADGSVYALTVGTGAHMAAYRSVNDGKKWQRLPGTLVGSELGPGMVTAAGSHVVRTDEGLLASQGGGPYRPIRLTGYPTDANQASHQVATTVAASRYLATSPSGLYLSNDGLAWTKIRAS